MPNTLFSSSRISTVAELQQPQKRYARAALAKRHPLTPREIARVCTTLLRIAEQVKEADPVLRTEARSDCCMSLPQEENTNA